MATISKVESQPAVAPKVISLRFVLGIILSVLSGVMLLLAFAPYNLWLLIWVGFVPQLIAEYRLMPARYARWAPGIAMTVWLWPMIARNFAGGPWYLVNMGLIIGVIVLLLSNG